MPAVEAVVEAFAQKARRQVAHPDAHAAARKLARLCALPRLLTPDLVAYLRERFLRAEVPWELEADLLLDAELCRPVGREQFVMLPLVRAHLAEEARQTLDGPTLRNVQFLITDYIDELVRSGAFIGPEEARLQRFWAMTLTAKGRHSVTAELVRALREESAESAGAHRELAEELLGPLGRPAELAGLIEPGESTAPEPFVGEVALRGSSATGGSWSSDGTEFVVAIGPWIARISSDGEVRYLAVRGALATSVAVDDGRLVVGFDHGGPAFYTDKSEQWARPDEEFRARVDDVSVAGGTTVCCGRTEGAKAYRLDEARIVLTDAVARRGAICVAAHPDGTRYAAGFENGDLVLAGEGPPRVHPKIHSGALNALCWSRAGDRLATASSDRKAVVTRAGTSGRVHELIHDADVVGVSFSHDDAVLATLDLLGIVRLWSCDDWRLLEAFETRKPGYYGGLAFHPHDGRLALYFEGAGTVDIRRINLARHAAQPVTRPVANRRALVVAFTKNRDHAERDARLVASALGGHAFFTATLTNPDFNTLAATVREFVDESRDDDFIAIHIVGQGARSKEALLIETAGATLRSREDYDLLGLNALLARRPGLRALLSLNAGTGSFLAECEERLTRFAVIGSHLDESDAYGHGYFSYAFAQALMMGPRFAEAMPLGTIFEETATRLLECRPRSSRLAPVRNLRGLGNLAIAAPPHSAGRPAFGRRVLWVDDQPGNNRRLIDEMWDRGVVVATALDTEQALRLFDHYRFNVVVTDMGRPPDLQAGYALIDALRERGPLPPCIVYSAHERPEHRAVAVSRGAVGSTSDPEQVMAWIGEAFEKQEADSRVRDDDPTAPRDSTS